MRFTLKYISVISKSQELYLRGRSRMGKLVILIVFNLIIRRKSSRHRKGNIKINYWN